MSEFIWCVVGVVIGVIGVNMIPALQTWGAKQASSIDKRWQALRADYDQFSSTARAEFEDIERRARNEIEELKTKYRK